MLDVQGGQLIGASGVDVDGTLYDVSFQDGRCVGLFDGCDSVNDFVFQTEASALSAANALLNSVFIDGFAGDFDSEPYLINGCMNFGVCFVYTPFNLRGAHIQYSLAGNEFVDINDFVVEGSVPLDSDTSSEPSFSWAVWRERISPAAATVPTPGSLALFALGFAGLGISRKRTKQ